MRISAAGQPTPNTPWVFTVFEIPPDTHSLVLELYGQNGGIIRLFPRGRSEMNPTATFANPGETLLCVTARGKGLQTIENKFVELHVGQTQSQAMGAPMGGFAATSFREVPVMGVQKPPLAFSGGRAAPAYGGPAAEPRYGINISGPFNALVGEVVRITASAAGNVASVQFSASNADMGWMMPQDISSGSASANARMTTEGTAYIYAKFLDQAQQIVQELSHAIQVARPADERPQPRSGSTDMTSLINAKTDAIMNRLKKS